jgi:hypothetical protein
VPGVHNSRWLQSPGHAVVRAPEQWGRLEAYVSGVVARFGADGRVLAWDLYNEPTNVFLVDQQLPRTERDAAMAAAARRRAETLEDHLRLLDATFAWARKAAPSQPLTAGLWFRDRELNARLAAASDIITFHNYEDAAALETHIGRLRRYGRPLLCTEWLARGRSDVSTHLPIFHRGRVGCYNWGLVNGKTQTHISWTGEDHIWFHDLLRADGRPYADGEAALFKALTAPGKV